MSLCLCFLSSILSTHLLSLKHSYLPKYLNIFLKFFISNLPNFLHKELKSSSYDYPREASFFLKSCHAMTLLVFDRLTGVFTVINGSFKHRRYKPITSQLWIHFYNKPKSYVIILTVKHSSVYCLEWCYYSA